jgi:hypothetical protein
MISRTKPEVMVFNLSEPVEKEWIVSPTAIGTSGRRNFVLFQAVGGGRF